MIKACIFDLDGTLLDTLADLAACVNGALAEQGFPGHPVDAFRFFVGDGVRTSVARALPEGARDTVTVDRITKGARAFFMRHGHRITKPYDGIPPMLEALEARGLPLAVLSNKPHPMTVSAVAEFFPKTPWRAVYGSSEETPAKPDLTGARRILNMLSVAPEEVLYLGDTNTDMLTAKGMNFLAVGVSWGFRPREELEKFGADTIVDHPRDVLSLLG